MNSALDEFLDHADESKLRLHEELKGMSQIQRQAYWSRIHEEARERGLSVVEAEEPAKRPPKRVRRTGQDPNTVLFP
jgi:hypothetical protein